MSFTVSQTIHANLFFRQWGQCGRVLRSFACSFARSFTIVLCLQNFFSSYVPLIAIRIIIVFVWWIFSFQHIDTWWEYYFEMKKKMIIIFIDKMFDWKLVNRLLFITLTVRSEFIGTIAIWTFVRVLICYFISSTARALFIAVILFQLRALADFCETISRTI